MGSVARWVVLNIRNEELLDTCGNQSFLSCFIL